MTRTSDEMYGLLRGGSHHADKLGPQSGRVLDCFERHCRALSELVEPRVLKCTAVKQVGLPVDPNEMPDSPITLQLSNRAIHRATYMPLAS